jgi:transcription elongation factor GreA
VSLTSTEGDVVRIGSRVRVRDDDGEDEFALVPEHDADACADRVSADSPLGRALLGRRVGERVRFRAPGGVMGVTVIAVEGRA